MTPEPSNSSGPSWPTTPTLEHESRGATTNHHPHHRARPFARSVALLPSQRLGRRFSNHVLAAIGRALARPPSPRRPAAGHIRSGCVHRALASLSRHGGASRWDRAFHPPCISALDRSPSGRPHVRAATIRALATQSYDTRIAGRLLRCREWIDRRKPLQCIERRVHRAAAHIGPRSTHTISVDCRSRARRGGGYARGRSSLQHCSWTCRIAVGAALSGPVVPSSSTVIPVDGGGARRGQFDLARWSCRARRADSTRPTLPFSPAARASTGPRDAVGCRSAPRCRGTPAPTRLVRRLCFVGAGDLMHGSERRHHSFPS